MKNNKLEELISKIKILLDEALFQHQPNIIESIEDEGAIQFIYDTSKLSLNIRKKISKNHREFDAFASLRGTELDSILNPMGLSTSGCFLIDFDSSIIFTCYVDEYCPYGTA